VIRIKHAAIYLRGITLEDLTAELKEMGDDGYFISAANNEFVFLTTTETKDVDEDA
jgi:hypothetical protein